MGEDAAPGASVKRLVGGRRDGLGGRLCAMVGAIRLSEVLGAEMKFIWPEHQETGDLDFHSLGPARDLFAADYVEQHLLETYDRTSYATVLRRVLTRSKIDAVATQASKNGIFITRWRSPVVLTGERRRAVKAGAMRAFASIRFNDAVSETLRMATQKADRSYVAVHARRGDLIYGTNRYTLYIDKFSPLAVIEAAIRSAVEAGKRVLLFSDTDKLVNDLARRYPVSPASSFYPDRPLGSLERAMIDIGLMAACSEIIGSGSAFAQTATVIGGAPRRLALDLFPAATWKELCLTHMAENPELYDRFERAKTLQFIALKCPDLPAEERAALLDRAIEDDPENYYYYLESAAERAGYDPRGAEKRLQEGFERHFAATGGETLSLLPYQRYFHHDKPAAKLAAAVAARRAPFLLAYSSDIAARDGEERQATELAVEASRLRPESPLLRARAASRLIATKDAAKASDLLGAEDPMLQPPIVHAVRAEAFSARRKNAAALESMRLAVAAAPGNAAFRARLAYLLQENGFNDEASATAYEAVALDPRDHAATLWAARTWYVLDDLETAVEWLTACCDLKPTRTEMTALAAWKVHLAKRRREDREAAAPNEAHVPGA